MRGEVDLNHEQSLLIFLGIDNLEKKEDLEKSTLTIRKKDTLRDLEEFFAPIEMEINDLCSEYHQSIKPPKYNKNNNVNLSKLESTTKIIQPSNNTKEYDNNNNLTSTTNNNNIDFEKTFLTDTQKLPQDQKNDFQKLQQNNTNNPQQLTTSQNNTAQQQNTPTQQHSTLQHNNNTQQTEKCVGCMKAITERYLLKVMDQSWHEDCLKCSCCNCRLGEVGSTLFTRANLMLCKRDYLRLFGASGYCSSCSKAIPAFEMVMKAKGHVYHLDCFSCYYCNHRFCVGDRYYLHDNKILCEVDYEEKVSNNRLNPNPSNNSNNPSNNTTSNTSLLMTSPSLPFPPVSPTYNSNNSNNNTNNNSNNSNNIANLKSKSYLNALQHHHHQQQHYSQLISSQPFHLHQQQQQQYLQQQQQQQHAINSNFINGLNSRS